MDIDKDGIPAEAVAEHLRLKGAAGDPRLEGGFVVFNGRIASGKSGWKWRGYTGDNPHTEHIHVSLSKAQAAYDSQESWDIRSISQPPDASPKRAGRPWWVNALLLIALSAAVGFGVSAVVKATRGPAYSGEWVGSQVVCQPDLGCTESREFTFEVADDGSVRAGGFVGVIDSNGAFSGSWDDGQGHVHPGATGEFDANYGNLDYGPDGAGLQVRTNVFRR